MHIGIDGLHLFGAYGGIQFSLARLTPALREEFPDDVLTLFVPRDFRGPPDPGERDRGLRFRRTWFAGRRRTIRTLWRNFRLQAHAYRAHCELLHGATYALPPVVSLPAVATFHDVIALTHPQFCTPGSARVQKHSLPRTARAARRLIVPTAFVRGEVERLLRVSPDRIDVVPWGVGDEFQVVADSQLLDEAREKWKLPARFALFVGTLEPKKDIEGLVKSFFAAKMHRKLPHELLIVGRMGWKMRGLPRLINELGACSYVHFTGYLPQKALALVYNLAELCVLPSHVEGFGMPVLEAMACGCPVVISEAPALVEVAGGAARVCRTQTEKPFQEMREAIEELLLDSGRLHSEMRAQGLARAAQFTWARTAKLTHASYEQALG